jgi:putative transposase
MGRKLEVNLTVAQREELEKGYRTGKSHAFRQRCRIVLLKSEGVFSKTITEIVDISSENNVNTWVKRYLTSYSTEGIKVLHNKSGQGRKAKLDRSGDEAKVRERVKSDRQRLSKAKELLEADLDKKFSLQTLRRFLKNLSADSSASD